MAYLFIAYVITLIAILGYVISLVRRRDRVRREAELLTQALEDRE